MKKGITVLLYIFFISTLIVPVSFINKLSFLMLIFLTILQISQSRQYTIPTFSPFIILIIFFYGFVISFDGNADSSLSVQFLLSVFILFLIYPIFHNNIDINKLVKVSGVFLMIATYLFYILTFKNVNFYGSDIILGIFQDYSSVALGSRSFGKDYYMMIHLGTIPFMYLPAYLYFKEYMEKKEIKALLILILMFIPMIWSTSRALVAGFILSIAALICIKAKGHNKILITTVVLCIIIMISTYVSVNSNALSAGEVSNAVKIGHMKSFMGNMTPTNALFGGGLATYYYSDGVNKYVPQTEITILDMVRYFGFVFTFILYCSLIIPVGKLNSYKGQGELVLIVFLIYLIMSMTNPILFNSMGSLVILWYWSNIIRNGAFK